MWARDAQLMRDTGLSLVRIGEFAWSRIEPEQGRFNWEWLDQAIAVLSDAGLKIVLGTPTATPPKWLVDTMPDMIALDSEGRKRGFASRRHYCFSHAGYAAQSARITREIARRYGQHPAITAWQTDNEYGCHNTVQSFSNAARDAFRLWLKARYETIEALNSAWGNVFWSMEYSDFDAVELPNLTVTEANPAHWLAFRRFSSDQVIAFNHAQVAIIREHSPERDITHNAMGFYTGYDHFALGDDLDVLGWDSYPLGFLEMFRFPAADKRDFARQGHPDIAAFHHDLYRGCARHGRAWVLEQQPGPVNWARYNPAPLPGMVKLWTIEAAAHGMEALLYFRWRQAPFAQEQMHAGLLRPDNQPAPGLGEAAEAAQELASLGEFGKPVKQAAIVFAYEAEWITQIQPHGQDLSALWAAFDCYSALRALGLNVAFVRPVESLEGYALVVVPSLPVVSDAMAAELHDFTGQIVIGPRSGSRTDESAIPAKSPPGPLKSLINLTVTRSESLAPHLQHEGDGWSISGWLDHCEIGNEAGAQQVEAEFVAKDGTVAGWHAGRVRYCATWPTGKFIAAVLARAADDASLPPNPLGRYVRQVTTEHGRFTFNYAAHSVTVDGEDMPAASYRYTADSPALKA